MVIRERERETKSPDGTRETLKQRVTSFSAHMQKVHQGRAFAALSALPGEVEIIAELEIPPTLQDALFQTIVVEIAQNYNALWQFFDLHGYDSLGYYREVLTETEGLDEARDKFDKTLVEKINMTRSEQGKSNVTVDLFDALTPRLEFERRVQKAYIELGKTQKSN